MLGGGQKPSEEVLLARQPIYERDLTTWGYEILFRDSSANAATFGGGDRATAEVMVRALLEIGLDSIVGVHRAFVNVTEHTLTSGFCELLPPDRVVLEVLESVRPTAGVIEAITRLRKKHYLIALDDFEYRSELEPLLDLAHIVKVDVAALKEDGTSQLLRQIAAHKPALLAEKVETHEEFELYQKMGFSRFQGYFFCKPNLISGRRAPANRLTLLRLLARLQDPTIQTSELESIAVQDLTLSYKLLRYINSAFTSFSKRVESVRHAINLVGQRMIGTWASLILLTAVDDKPRELMITALVRAKMCELLAATESSMASKEVAFTVGLFSAVDALLDCPLDEALQQLPLNEEIRVALLEKKGELGRILNCVQTYERGEWTVLAPFGFSPGVLQDAYQSSLSWTAEVLSHLSAVEDPA